MGETRGRFVLCGVLLVGACADPATPCGGGGECPGGSTCDEGQCLRLCNTTDQCGTGELCGGGLCRPSFCVIGGTQVAEGDTDPQNPCHVCAPRVSTSAFSPAPDDTSCTDGVFCNGTDRCVGGACLARDDACPADHPLCTEATSTCSCTPTSCDDGLFCNGAEACVLAAGQCAAGAVPTCVGDSPHCSEDVAACVGCRDENDCAEPNPYCVGYRCASCPTCGCPFGEHDGGDGTCVLEGLCVTGYQRAYVDGDFDGHGIGELSDDCIALLPGPVLPQGYASVGGDCDDGNAVLWDFIAGYPDIDTDTYTGPVEELCVATLPAEYSATANPPPYGGSVPRYALNYDGSLPGGLENWDVPQGPDYGLAVGGESVVCGTGINSGDACRHLLVFGFDLDVPLTATVTNLKVHILRGRQGGNTDAHVVDLQVQLADVTFSRPTLPTGDPSVSALTLLGTNRADTVTHWPANTGFADKVYEGDVTTWGTALTPEVLNSPGFGLTLRAIGAVSGGGGREAVVDAVWIEVFIADSFDCDDDDPAVFAARSAFTDVDGDAFTVGPIHEVCNDGSGSGLVLVGSASDDCYDANALAYPGSTTGLPTHRGDGSFDYDCDDLQTKLCGTYAASNANCGTCNTTTCTGGTNSPTMEYCPGSGSGCGATYSVLQCLSVCPCSPQTTQVPVYCR